MSERASTHWKSQRITALTNVPLVMWFVFTILALAGKSHAETTEFFKDPINAGFMALVIISLFYHAALGLQVVIEDYVHGKPKQVIRLVKFALLALGIASLAAIGKLYFG